MTMERKLELKEFIGYIPYGLIGIYKSVKEPQQGFRCLNGRIVYYINDNIKPILRPLSDLYRTITHNGEKIIPILKLAKILVDTNWKYKEYKMNFNRKCAEWKISKRQKYQFFL